MNVLLVDDQQIIIDSLVNGIDWKSYGVSEIYKATSAMEAKLIMTNFAVDLLITDIEMPEENGVALAEWVRDKFGRKVVIVFLTSHPSFTYAQEGLKLRIFDYLLQPVRFTELAEVVSRVKKELDSRQDDQRLQKYRAFAKEHQNAIYDTIVLKAFTNCEEESRKLYQETLQLYRDQHGECCAYMAYLEVRQFALVHEKWSDELLRSTFCNVLSELFQEVRGEASAASIQEGEYFLFVLCDSGKLPAETVRGIYDTFARFFNCRTSPNIRLSADLQTEKEDFILAMRRLRTRLQNADRAKELVLEGPSNAEESETGLAEQAEKFIKEHIFQKITRTDVADYVHLNPDYFSRLFRKETGLSFKDYVLREKMRRAADMLAHTKFSIGIIASKIGFDNFSHFSQTFRNYYHMSPQDYRNAKNGS